MSAPALATWIFLRGWSRETRHWGEFPDQFREAMPSARVVAVDLPGSGSLNERPSPRCIEQMMQQTRRRLIEAQEEGPYHLLGLSMGAMVCVEWAARYPAEVRACVLLSTSLRPFSPFFERLRPQSYAALLGLAFFEHDVLRREEAILRLTSAHPAALAGLPATWARLARERPVSPINVLRQLAAAARYRAAATPPPVPLLVLAGAMDRLVHPRCSEVLARRWKAPLAVHPAAGHDLALDEGRWVAAQVKSWAGRYPVTPT